MKLPHPVYFVAGIDTDIGKTHATAHIARSLSVQGRKTITHKPVQTGSSGLAGDIVRHRRLTHSPLLPEDRCGLTMPQIFAYPASPHLAAERQGQSIDFAAIHRSIDALRPHYDSILVEGAGGLLVPLTRSLLQADWVAAQGWPVILVSGGRLGSINHTLLSLEALDKRGIPLAALAYNHYFDHADPVIGADTQGYLKTVIAERFPAAEWLDIPVLTVSDTPAP